MTLDDLINEARQDNIKLEETRSAVLDELQTLSAQDNPSDEDTAKGKELLTRAQELRENIAAAESNLNALLERKKSSDRQEELRAALAASPAAPVRVTDEPSTYSSESRNNFFIDLVNRSTDSEAAERINRNQSETRATGTTDHPGIVIPQYLLGEFAELARNGRVFADTMRSVPLPANGMQMHIGRGATSTAFASQAGQNAALATGDTPTSDDLNITVETIGAYVDVSLQAIERGSLVQELVMSDLMDGYGEELNRQVIEGTGATNELRGVLNATGINAVTYTDASPTLGELYLKIADAVQRVSSIGKRAPSHIFMNPRRWGWLAGQTDSEGRPLLSTHGGSVSAAAWAAIQSGVVPTGQVGEVAGLPVILDPGIPTDLGVGTDEDVIIVGAMRESILMEGSNAPRFVRVESTVAHTLGVRFVAYEYATATFERRANAFSAITGTGLITPTF